MYEIIDTLGSSCIKRTDADGVIWFIPFDEANSDYQAYLMWLAEQDVAE